MTGTGDVGQTIPERATLGSSLHLHIFEFFDLTHVPFDDVVRQVDRFADVATAKSKSVRRTPGFLRFFWYEFFDVSEEVGYRLGQVTRCLSEDLMSQVVGHRVILDAGREVIYIRITINGPLMLMQKGDAFDERQEPVVVPPSPQPRGGELDQVHVGDDDFKRT